MFQNLIFFLVNGAYLAFLLASFEIGRHHGGLPHQAWFHYVPVVLCVAIFSPLLFKQSPYLFGVLFAVVPFLVCFTLLGVTVSFMYFARKGRNREYLLSLFFLFSASLGLLDLLDAGVVFSVESLTWILWFHAIQGGEGGVLETSPQLH